LLKRASEAEAKLKRLYDATENGVAGVSDPPLKERVTELKAIRDQARADAERAEGAQARGAQDLRQPSPQACGPRPAAIAATTCARWPSAPKWTRKEVRIMGSTSVLLRTLVAAGSTKTAGFGVPSSVPKWCAGHDSNV
jgi:site-specific DNA recombinase